MRLAIQAGRKLLISERAIVTPAARDLAEEHRVITFPVLALTGDVLTAAGPRFGVPNSSLLVE